MKVWTMMQWDKEPYESYWDGLHRVFSTEEAAQGYYDANAKRFSEDDEFPYALSDLFDEQDVL